MARADLEALEPRREELEQQLRIAACCPRTPPTSAAPSWRCAPAPAATRRRCSPPTCSACTARYAELQRLEDGDHLDLGERPRRLQGDRRLDLRRGRVRAAEVRIRRAPRAAHPGDRDGRAHPHLGGDGRGAARGRGGRRRHPAGGHPHRHHARRRRRRPARQQDGLGRAHDAFADRHHGRLGREVAAPEPPARHAGAALARL